MTVVSSINPQIHQYTAFNSKKANKTLSNYATNANYTSPSFPFHTLGLNYFVSDVFQQIVNNPVNESSPIQDDGSVRLKIGYINDVHGQYVKLEKIANALGDCDIRFSGGDNLLGSAKNLVINKSIVKYLDRENIEASALGNHELDMDKNAFNTALADAKIKYMALNFHQNGETKVNNPAEYIKDKMTDSYVGEYKGVKYGVVGLAPNDLFMRLGNAQSYSDCNVDDLDTTINLVQEEVNKLKEQGINKIFLLSHIGHVADRKIAQNTSGIDVIIGGHSHHYVQDITPGENWFLSKSNEPVLLTSAEKDGNYYGKADLIFDKNGVITNASNHIYDTNERSKNLIYKNIFDSFIGKPEKVGYIKSALPAPKMRLIEENPHSNFVADALKNYLNTDIALINGGNIRNSFEPGSFDTSDAKSILPFGDEVVVANVREKDIVDAIKITSKSLTDVNGKPGLMTTSGLKYSVKKGTGELLSMSYVDKNGVETPIDINNPRTDKTYKVAAGSFVLKGREGLDMLNYYDKAEKVYDFSQDKVVCEYIKSLNKPVEINQVGRIILVD